MVDRQRTPTLKRSVVWGVGARIAVALVALVVALAIGALRAGAEEGTPVALPPDAVSDVPVTVDEDEEEDVPDEDEEEDVEEPDEFTGIFVDVETEDFNFVDVCYEFGREGEQPDPGCTEDGIGEIPVTEPGRYVFTVTSVPDGCAIVSPNPQVIDLADDDLVPGETVAAVVLLDCGTGPEPDAEVLVDAYVCEQPDRAGEVDFFVGGGTVFASDTRCRLAAAGEQTFRLVPFGDRPEREAATDATGRATFADVPFGTYAVTEVGSGATSAVFTVEPPFPPDDEFASHGAFAVTAITYVAAVTPPPPGDGPGTVEVVVHMCFDESRGGDTDVFIGSATVQAQDVDHRCFGEFASGFTIDGDALDEPIDVRDFVSPMVAANLPPGLYVVTLHSTGQNSPQFELAPGGYVRVTFVLYSGSESSDLIVGKAFCADPDRAGRVDFIAIAGAAPGGEVVIEMAAEPAAPACRLARNGEVSFLLTETTTGRSWTRTTTEGAGSAYFRALPFGEFVLTEAGTGASSEPFTLAGPGAFKVVNWVAEVDQTPPPPTQDLTLVRLDSILCVDPVRAGETEFLIGSGSYGGPPFESAEASTTTCEVDIGSAFDLAPAEGSEPIRLVTDLFGSALAEVDPGRYLVTIAATGESTPPFDVPVGGPTIVTVVRWVAEVEPRALLLIHKTTCPIETTDPISECYENGLAGVEFTIGDQEVMTNEHGIAVVGIPAGEVVIAEDSTVLADYDGAYVRCAAASNGPPPPFPGEGSEPLVDGRADGGTVAFAVPPGWWAACEWSNLIGTDAGATPTPAPAPTATATPDTGGVTTLPRTGVARPPARDVGSLALPGAAGALLLLLLMAARRRSSAALPRHERSDVR